MLEDDTDLAMMNLTRMYQNPEDYVQPFSVEVLEDHEEMELLLEAYLQVGDIHSPTSRLGCRICMLSMALSRVTFFSRRFARGFDRQISIPYGSWCPKTAKEKRLVNIYRYAISLFSGYASLSFIVFFR